MRCMSALEWPALLVCRLSKNSDGYHGWMYFDIVLRYELLVLIISFSLPSRPKLLYIGYR